MVTYLRGACRAPPPGTGRRVIAAQSLARQFDGVVDDADAAQHGDV